MLLKLLCVGRITSLFLKVLAQPSLLLRHSLMKQDLEVLFVRRLRLDRLLHFPLLLFVAELSGRNCEILRPLNIFSLWNSEIA